MEEISRTSRTTISSAFLLSANSRQSSANFFESIFCGQSGSTPLKDKALIGGWPRPPLPEQGNKSATRPARVRESRRRKPPGKNPVMDEAGTAPVRTRRRIPAAVSRQNPPGAPVPPHHATSATAPHGRLRSNKKAARSENAPRNFAPSQLCRKCLRVESPDRLPHKQDNRTVPGATGADANLPERDGFPV